MKKYKIAKGWREITSSDSFPTQEELTEYLMEIFYNGQEKQKEERKIVAYQHCKNKGWIDVSGLDITWCNDPTCSCAQSLEMFHEALKEEAKTFLDYERNN